MTRAGWAPSSSQPFIKCVYYFSCRLPHLLIWSLVPFVPHACQTLVVLIAMTGLPGSYSNSAATLAHNRSVPARTGESTSGPSTARNASFSTHLVHD
ncbi:hypothetical protein K469DRAFT_211875 [Zopfia rhizophila CBS 207.26]|uniref:Uncharacterized protein n=1 Tax=Zopfia rhizophila CBS 207.26 TaxID=1314779 RepID=A0A6A6D8Y0_9PEZI|nr:hypothetical protein K469DRAFT_211875 [Zopfia rhizophila CBS 207.26]